jgi:hypothetical protein
VVDTGSEKPDCSVEDCGRPARSRGWCMTHYMRWRNHGDANWARQIYPDPDCRVDGCNKSVRARGWCQTHYSTWHRHGDVNWVRSSPPDPIRCAVNGCEKFTEARGWCSMHLKRWRKHGDPEYVRTPEKVPCSIADCENPTKARGWCMAHYKRWKNHGDANWVPPVKETKAPTQKRLETPKPCEMGDCGRFQVARGMCQHHYSRWLRRESPQGVVSDWNWKRLTYDYGVDREWYEKTLADQGGGCAICGSTAPGQGERFSIDHDHGCCPGRKSCGRCVRGLLCRSCNLAIGLFEDNLGRVQSAASYLTDWKKTGGSSLLVTGVSILRAPARRATVPQETETGNHYPK